MVWELKHSRTIRQSFIRVKSNFGGVSCPICRLTTLLARLYNVSRSFDRRIDCPEASSRDKSTPLLPPIPPPRDWRADISPTQSTVTDSIRHAHDSPFHRHQSNLRLISSRMTSSTYCRATTANQRHSFSEPSQAHSNACNEYQPPNANKKYHRYARKSTSKYRLRSVKVSLLVEHVNGHKKETLGKDPMCGN